MDLLRTGDGLQNDLDFTLLCCRLVVFNLGKWGSHRHRRKQRGDQHLAGWFSQGALKTSVTFLQGFGKVVRYVPCQEIRGDLIEGFPENGTHGPFSWEGLPLHVNPSTEIFPAP